MEHVDLIKHTYDELDKNFSFITLRNFHLIPDQSSLENDIDLLIKKEDYKKVAHFMAHLGYHLTYDTATHDYLYGASSHIHCVNRTANVHFDIVSGLYYRSLSRRNLFVGGYGKLEEHMWENKIKVPLCYKYQPATEDLLTHLCCHAVFDKMEVNAYYGALMEELYKKADEEKLQELFALAFFKASTELLGTMESGNIFRLVEKYIGFSDY